MIFVLSVSTGDINVRAAYVSTGEIKEPIHEILELIAHAQNHSLNVHSRLSSSARDLIFGLSLPLLPYFMYASSECSDETARMRRLV